MPPWPARARILETIGIRGSLGISFQPRASSASHQGHSIPLFHRSVESKPSQLEGMDEVMKPMEESGFSIIQFSPGKVTFGCFCGDLRNPFPTITLSLAFLTPTDNVAWTLVRLTPLVHFLRL
jgi:hypothetical protein